MSVWSTSFSQFLHLISKPTWSSCQDPYGEDFNQSWKGGSFFPHHPFGNRTSLPAVTLSLPRCYPRLHVWLCIWGAAPGRSCAGCYQMGWVTGSTQLAELCEVLHEKCSLCGTKEKYCQEQKSMQELLRCVYAGSRARDKEKTSPQFTGVAARLPTWRRCLSARHSTQTSLATSSFLPLPHIQTNQFISSKLIIFQGNIHQAVKLLTAWSWIPNSLRKVTGHLQEEGLSRWAEVSGPRPLWTKCTGNIEVLSESFHSIYSGFCTDCIIKKKKKKSSSLTLSIGF